MLDRNRQRLRALLLGLLLFSLLSATALGHDYSTFTSTASEFTNEPDDALHAMELLVEGMITKTFCFLRLALCYYQAYSEQVSTLFKAAFTQAEPVLNALAPIVVFGAGVLACSYCNNPNIPHLQQQGRTFRVLWAVLVQALLRMLYSTESSTKWMGDWTQTTYWVLNKPMAIFLACFLLAEYKAFPQRRFDQPQDALRNAKTIAAHVYVKATILACEGNVSLSTCWTEPCVFLSSVVLAVNIGINLWLLGRVVLQLLQGAAAVEWLKEQVPRVQRQWLQWLGGMLLVAVGVFWLSTKPTSLLVIQDSSDIQTFRFLVFNKALALLLLTCVGAWNVNITVFGRRHDPSLAAQDVLFQVDVQDASFWAAVTYVLMTMTIEERLGCSFTTMLDAVFYLVLLSLTLLSLVVLLEIIVDGRLHVALKEWIERQITDRLPRSQLEYDWMLAWMRNAMRSPAVQIVMSCLVPSPLSARVGQRKQSRQLVVYNSNQYNVFGKLNPLANELNEAAVSFIPDRICLPGFLVLIYQYGRWETRACGCKS
jgi:hypothetical protein